MIVFCIFKNASLSTLKSVPGIGEKDIEFIFNLFIGWKSESRIWSPDKSNYLDFKVKISLA